MYQAFHQIIPLQQKQSASMTAYDVVGPICESGDWLGRDRDLSVQAGDHLAVLSAGAYCMAMSSNYNTRARAAEILIDGSQAHVIRSRETITEQIQSEHLI